MTYKVFPGEPADPSQKECDWCGAPAQTSHELHKNRKKMGTAMFLYACHEHSEKARKAAEGYKQPKTKDVPQERIVGPGGTE